MSAEDDARKVIDAAAKLQLGIDQQLKNTEWDDQQTLEEHNMMFGEHHEQATKVVQAQYRQRLRGIRKVMAELNRRGWTPEVLVQKQDATPQAYGETYEESIPNYFDKLDGKGKKGGDPFFSTDRMVGPSAAQSAKAKAAAKKGRGTDADMDKVLGALLGFAD